MRGYQTTEFWMTLTTILTSVAGCLFGVLPKYSASMVTAAVVVGYSLSRGLAKQRTPQELQKYD